MKKFILIAFILPLYIYASVGKILAMRGDITIQRDSGDVSAKTGITLENKDVIKTSKKSKAQIKLNDGTMVTVGKSTVFKIEDYMFDGTKNSKAQMKVMKGVFSSITGKIGKIAKNRFKLKTKTASIGIRGTHFTGIIDDKNEVIACVRGAITVTAAGQTVDVPAGQITSIKSGSAPSTPRKISDSNGLTNEDGTLNKDQINEKFNELANIKDKDEYLEKFDEILNQVVDEYNELLGTENKVDVTSEVNSEVSDIKLGFYKQDEVSKDGLTLESISTLEDNELKDTIQHLNYTLQTFLDPAEGLENTAKETIQDKMGGVNEATGSLYQSWDGSADNSRKIATYEGNILGTVAYGYNSEQGLKVIDPSQNEAKFIIDYGSKALQGNIYYKVKDLDGEIKEVDKNILSIGHYTVSGSSFDIINKDSTDSSIKTILQATSYYGDDAKTISGYFGVAHEDFFANSILPNKIAYLEGTGATVTEESIEETDANTKWSTEVGFENPQGNTEDFNLDGYADGIFLATKTDEIELVKKTLFEVPNYFSYGYWAKEDFDINTFHADGIAVDELGVSGAWIKTDIEKTSEDTINQYIENSVEASYSGSVIGTVHNPDIVAGTNMVSPINSGTIDLNFNFSQNKVDGNINFKANEETWNVDFTRGAINTNSFIFHNVKIDSDNIVTYENVGNIVDSTNNEVSKINTLDGSGNFYGTNADYAAGGFKLGTDQNSFAVGAFTTQKQ
jgi:hypothetical protein